MMLSHVYKFPGSLYSLERSLQHRLRTSDKSHDSPVGRLTRVHIQHLHPRSFARGLTSALLNCRHNGVDYCFIASLAEIGHAFDDPFHIRYISKSP